jgi:antitoxin component YwqK of YwqJK toxin-antitoxin module
MRVDFDEVDWDDDLLLIHDGAPFTGEVVEKTRDGAVVAVTGYTDGYEDGPSTEWFPTGELKFHGVARRGWAVGVHQVWHRNGRLASERAFDDEGHQLSNREWDENGNLLEESIYRR